MPDVSKLKSYILTLVVTYKFYLLLLITVATLAGIFEVLVSYKTKEIIDAIAQDKCFKLNLLLVFFVLYKLMHHGVYFISRLLDLRYKPIIVEKTLSDMYNQTVQHSLHRFESHLSGEVSSKIFDFQNNITILLTYLFQAFHSVATIFVVLIFLIDMHALTALVLFIFILIYIPILYLLLKKQIRLQELHAQSKQATVGIINDSITNIFSIKVIGSLLAEYNLNIKPTINRLVYQDKKVKRFDTYYIDNADTVMVVTMNGVQIYLLAHLYQQSAITGGEFAFIAMMTLKIHGLLNSFLENLLFNINPSVAQIRSSHAFVNTTLDVLDEHSAVQLTDVQGAISYQNVHFSYGDHDKQVLKQLNLQINAGEQIGITGKSGAGKTTMIKCLLRYFDVSDGSILIDEQDIRNITQESLRKAISIIPQDITMFHRSIKENLKLAKCDATDDEIATACKQAKIHAEIMKMPLRYDTVIGERGMKLSGGQRQRLAIARAILKDAPILILDEATSNLDTPTEELIQDALSHFFKKGSATVIAIAHRLSTLKHMDKIIVLDHGTIVELGTHMEESG